MQFVTHLVWSGAKHGPTRNTATYSRDLELTLSSGALPASAAPAYHGDPARANPEELFVAAVSACQALTYLFLAARESIAVVSYEDEADGELHGSDGRMRMTRVRLRPRIVIEAGGDERRARELAFKAHARCFIANSVTAEIDVEPTVAAAPERAMAGHRG